jgi:hypothetical protein
MGCANALSAPSNLSGRRINDRGPTMPVSLRLRKTVGYTDNQRAIGGVGAIADVQSAGCTAAIRRILEFCAGVVGHVGEVKIVTERKASHRPH